jgi:hypothetical protein
MRATFLSIERGLYFLLFVVPVACAAAEGCSTKRWNESAQSVFSE